MVDIANAHASSDWMPPSHHYDDLAASVPVLSSEFYWGPMPPPPHEPYPSWDPLLPSGVAPTNYADIFVDDFVGLAQTHKQSVHCILLEAVNEVFLPLYPIDPATRQEPVSIKKLLESDGSWNAIKLVLGWILDTDNLTL
jgi:hypothetical protein